MIDFDEDFERIQLMRIKGAGSVSTHDFVRESNRIEGITREPTQAEIDAHDYLMWHQKITIPVIQQFVSVYQPDARLRDELGLNVRVGRHMPPTGGPEIRNNLNELLKNMSSMSPFEFHFDYEQLHPFTDCNGRSGRAIWAWMMRRDRGYPLGFLHHWYYQSLAG